MGFLETSTGTASILTRFLAYVFLQVIPGRYGALVYWPALYYIAGILLVQSKLKGQQSTAAATTVEPAPPAAAEQNSRKQQTKQTKAIESKPANGTPKKHEKKPSYAQVVKQTPPHGADHSETKQLDLSPGSSDRQVVSRKAGKGAYRPSSPGPVTLLTGSPTRSRFVNWVSLLINLALIAMCADLQFTPLIGLNVPDTTFVRVGAVTDTSVKLVARLPPSLWAGDSKKVSNNSLLDEIVPPSAARIVYRPTKPHGAWQYGGVLAPQAETDYVGALKLDSLLPSTEYEYALVLPEHVNDERLQPSVHHPQYFKTAPDPRLARHQTHFTFAASSCIKPGWPYSPFEDNLAVKGASELADRIGRDKLEFLLFMGDFIYADVPHPVTSQSAYMKKYRQVYASKDYRRVYERIPTYHIYDDHEIYNDYAGEGNDTDTWFSLANPAYSAYLGSGNPDSVKPNAHYYDFQYGDAAFFVWDTRRYRTRNEAADDDKKTMLGQEQKDVFINWLAEVNQTATFKFVVSSVPFMTLWGGPNAWGGFQTERNELMDIMQYVPNVIVLSGDRHEFAAAIIRESVLDFSISPLNQFYLKIRTLSQKHGLGATGEDRLIKYIPDGNRKFATFEVDTRVASQPVVAVKLYVDGEEAWKLDVLGRPVIPPAPLAGVGRNLALSISELLGFGRGWF